MKSKGNRVYLDYAATTPIDPKVQAVMKRAALSAWGNPSSLHFEGEQAKNLLEQARKDIAHILHCRSEEVYFTSGGTEAANLAILGLVKNKNNSHIICSTIEHPAVLEAVKNSGAEVSLVAPDENGIINPESIKREVKENTILVCLMHSNNEIGTIQPVRQVSRQGVPLLVDASQSALYEDVSVERLGADILILDGIKMYGPRGAGILVVKRAVQDEISPVFFGGGQEKGIRSGTENVVSAVGLAEALKIAVEKRGKESERITKLREYVIERIISEIPDSSLNGDSKMRLPNNINICFPGSDSEFLVIKLDTLGFAVSAASACNSLKLENSSYVIESLGKKNCSGSSIRVTLGRETTKSDLDKLIKALKEILLEKKGGAKNS